MSLQCPDVDPTARAAIGKLSIDCDGRYGSNTQTASPLGDVRVIHVQDPDLAGWARQLLDLRNGFGAEGASGTEDLESISVIRSHQAFSHLAPRTIVRAKEKNLFSLLIHRLQKTIGPLIMLFLVTHFSGIDN